MHINELSHAKQKAVARELRKLIEPEKAYSKRIIKETEIRKSLIRMHLTYHGLSDLISVLTTNYSKKTISRLVSKVQKSIVWDTCLCHLSPQELTDLFFNSEYENIITRSVYDELIKLSIVKTLDTTSSENAFRLVTNILEDTESIFCSVIDLPPELLNNKYVDNQLLSYCKQNNYTLYTHDYVLGLRARSRTINVKIFTNFDQTNIEQYTPASEGKNMILDCSLLNSVSLSDILTTAKSIKGNKFLLTQEFVESLESASVKKDNRDLINFLVSDSDCNYTIYASEKETSDLPNLTEKYNAIVLSPDIEQCITYKNYFIPYKVVYPKDMALFKSNALISLKSSPYSNYDNISEDDVKEAESETTLDNQSCNQSNDNLSNNNSQNPIRMFVPPHFIVQTGQVNISKLAPNERMWVLDETGTDLTYGTNSRIKLCINYTVIHIENSLNNFYNLTVYRVINHKAKCCLKVISLSFDKENIESSVPREYQSFARISVKLT